MTESSKNLYADLVLPLALHKLYTYKIPGALAEKISTGFRVVVQFGKTKMYTALVYAVHNNRPQYYEPKEILEVLDSFPVVTTNQLKLWDWLSEYYLCTLGEILIAAMPTVMKLQSESIVALNPLFVSGSVLLTSEEQLIVDHLASQKSLSVADASKLIGQKYGLHK